MWLHREIARLRGSAKPWHLVRLEAATDQAPGDCRMSLSSTRTPWMILGTASLGALCLSLFSVAPTPAQIGAAPTATFVTAGQGTPVPTRTTAPSSGGVPAQFATPTPTWA